MTRNQKPSTHSIAVKLSIWSIRHQSWLAGQLRIYIYGATALVALLALADVISIQTAMLSVFCGGAVVSALIWTLVQHRRAILLSIQDPEVRDQAYAAMLEYLSQVDCKLSMANSGNQEQNRGRLSDCAK